MCNIEQWDALCKCGGEVVSSGHLHIYTDQLWISIVNNVDFIFHVYTKYNFQSCAQALFLPAGYTNILLHIVLYFEMVIFVCFGNMT